MKHSNRMHAYLSEEFYISVFVETNIFLISAGQCFSLKYLSRFFIIQTIAQTPTPRKPSLGFSNPPETKLWFSVQFSEIERPMKSCNCLTLTGLLQQVPDTTVSSQVIQNPTLYFLGSRREPETFPQCPHLALVMSTGKKLHAIGIIL